MTIKRFEDLEIFKMAREMSKRIFALTLNQPFNSDYRFVQQIRAASGSIMDNIAEGFERDGNKEFKQFLYIAKGSCGETRSQIIRATDCGYIDNEQAKEIYEELVKLSRAIATMIKSLKESEINGLKHKD
ncbi:MAG: four helix bundle protein [Paludibacteraceae bacterium]|nr:four helix bundle protein [Paludibacteraceae bacterium]